MTGHGVSGGALTVINAIATGYGAAFGVNLSTRAAVTLDDEPEITLTINGEAAPAGFAEALVAGFAAARPAAEIAGAHIETASDIPPSVGLKSSSAAANAILMALCDATGCPADPIELIRIGARASITAGVSITGAFDDAAACMLGGLVFTDNRTMTLLERRPMPEEYTAVIALPSFSVPTLSFPREKFAAERDRITAAFALARAGNIRTAMYENGRAASDALKITPAAADRALACGAAAAGLSGTGPATGILVATSSLDEFLDAFGRDSCIITSIRNGYQT